MILLFLECAQLDRESTAGLSRAEMDERDVERGCLNELKDLIPGLCSKLQGIDLNEYVNINNDIHRDEEEVEIANFTEKSTNEMQDIEMNAKSYELTNEVEHEEDEDDNIDLEEILESPLLDHHANNAGYEEDDNFLITNDKDDQVEFPEDNPDEAVDDLTNFYNKVPGLEHVMRGAIKRCRTGLPEAIKGDKSDLFHKYRGNAYVTLRAFRFIITKFQLRERPTTALLKILNKLWDTRIPTDVRCITRHTYEVKRYELEKDIHCCDLPVEQLVKSMLIEYQSMGEQLPETLKIHFNADGLQTSLSSNAQLYVFLLGFPQLKWDPIVMCHILNGSPTNQAYYKPTIEYLNKVQKHGIPDVLPNGEVLRVDVEGGFFDRQGLSKACWIVSHVAKDGCPHCRIEGATLVSLGLDPQGKLPGSRTVNFYLNLPVLEIDWTMEVAARDNKTARNRQESNVKQINGHTPTPPIFELFDEFDVIQQVPGDSLHQVYLAQKQFFIFIVTGAGATITYNRRNKPTAGEVRMMQNRIKKCHTFVTRKVFKNRIPRAQFYEKHQKYKASEIRCMVLYCYPIALGVLRNEAIKRIGNTLFYLLRILENASLIERFIREFDDMDTFNSQLRRLVEEYSHLFGMHTITYNRHAWLHLAHWVARFGPLSSWGCWRFENFNHHLATFVHAGHVNPITEACNRYFEWCSTSFFLNWEKPKQYHSKYWLEEAREVNILECNISNN